MSEFNELNYQHPFNLDHYQSTADFDKRMYQAINLFNNSADTWQLLYENRNSLNSIIRKQNEIPKPVLDRPVPAELVPIVNYVTEFHAERYELQRALKEESSGIDFRSKFKQKIQDQKNEFDQIMMKRLPQNEVGELHEYLIQGIWANDIEVITPDLLQTSKKAAFFANRMRRDFATAHNSRDSLIIIIPSLSGKNEKLDDFYAKLAHERVHLVFKRQPELRNSIGQISKEQQLLFEEMFACLEQERVESLFSGSSSAKQAKLNKYFEKNIMNTSLIQKLSGNNLPLSIVALMWSSFEHSIDQLQHWESPKKDQY